MTAAVGLALQMATGNPVFIIPEVGGAAGMPSLWKAGVASERRISVQNELNIRSNEQ